MPKFKTFSGFGDPDNHLKSFDSQLSFWASDDEKRTREAHTPVLKIQEAAKDNDPKKKESEKHGEPHEELELVRFRVEQKSKTFRIGMKLPPIHRKELICLVREFEKVFAWAPEDMPGVDTELSLHRLHADSSYRPVKQKKRNFLDEKNLAIQKEVEEVVNVGNQ
ncbi:hypothetical protein LIER_28762 [Lithospermum erythrorhizon]|uniref:Uncharacterized protein n=1 Tax=Lithospermum erythrorhizon TaxID=34254 RepID=A0AAV3RKG5_LITER